MNSRGASTRWRGAGEMGSRGSRPDTPGAGGLGHTGPGFPGDNDVNSSSYPKSLQPLQFVFRIGRRPSGRR